MLIIFSLLTFVCRYGLELAAYPVWPFHSVHHMVQLPVTVTLSVPSLSLSLSLSGKKNPVLPVTINLMYSLSGGQCVVGALLAGHFLSGIHCGTEASDQYLIIVTRRYTLPPRLLQWSEEVYSDTVLSYNKHGCVHLSSSSCIQKCSDF